MHSLQPQRTQAAAASQPMLNVHAGAVPDATGVELRRRFIDNIPGQDRVVWDLHRNGALLIGAPTEKAATNLLLRLRQSRFGYLEQYNTGPAHPYEWVRIVRDLQWTFDGATIEAPDRNGRARFSGNIQQYSNASTCWFSAPNWPS